MSKPEDNTPRLEDLDPAAQEFVELYQEVLEMPRGDDRDQLTEDIDQMVTAELDQPGIAKILRGMAHSAFKDTTARYDQFSKKEPLIQHTTSVDLSKIGWVPGQDTVEVQLEGIGTVFDKREQKDKNLFFTDITDLGNATTKCMDSLRSQTEKGGVVADTLLDSLKQTVVPVLYDSVTSGADLRIVNISTGRGSRQRFVNTEYPAYKEDVLGTNNRAILLLLENTPDQTVFALAALYDHDDDKVIHNALSK